MQLKKRQRHWRMRREGTSAKFITLLATEFVKIADITLNAGGMNIMIRSEP